MTGPADPDPTRPLGGGDATLPAGPRPGGSSPDGPVTVGPPPGGPPRGPVGDNGDEPRRNWWWIAAAALAFGIAVGVIVALLAGSGDDGTNDVTTTSSSTTTTQITSPPVTSPPTSPPTTPSPPGQVLNLTAAAGGGSGEVELHWDAVPGAAQYRIYRSSTMGTTGSMIASSNLTNYLDVPGAHAYYQVSAVSSGGLEGDRSVEVCGAPVGDSC